MWRVGGSEWRESGVMSDLSGKVALVTGASSGIGLATARLLREKGAAVITCQRRKAEGFENIIADLLDPNEPSRVIDEVRRAKGRLDILVNNAGLMREAPCAETKLEDWSDTLALNLTAPFLLTKAAVPLMRLTGGGSIVNVSSIESLGSNPGHAAYCASKAGLNGLTHAVAVDHGAEGIRCNAVAPGWIDTPLNVDFIESQPDPAVLRNKIGSIHPLRRTGRPGEVAEMIVWLASDAASFVTGQIFTIDGGRTVKLSLP